MFRQGLKEFFLLLPVELKNLHRTHLVDSFNGNFRKYCLDLTWSSCLKEA